MSTTQCIDGEAVYANAHEADFQSGKCHFSIPTDNLNLRQLIDVLRLFELLCCFRAITPKGRLEVSWLREYVTFRTKQSRKMEEIGKPPFQWCAQAAWFESWIKYKLSETPLFPLVDIRKGSYEFVLSLVNLAVVFGLQDYSLLKDSVQWAASTLQSLSRSAHVAEDTVLLEGPRKIDSDIVRSGNSATIRITPDLIKAVSAFEEVEFREIVTKGKRTLIVKLNRASTGLTPG